MHGVGLDLDVRSWFSDEAPARPRAARARASRRRTRAPRLPPRVPTPKVPRDLIAKALRDL